MKIRVFTLRIMLVLLSFGIYGESLFAENIESKKADAEAIVISPESQYSLDSLSNHRDDYSIGFKKGCHVAVYGGEEPEKRTEDYARGYKMGNNYCMYHENSTGPL